MIAMIALLAAAAPVTTGAPSAPAAKLTLQQQYDAAVALSQGHDCAAAIPAFEELEGKPSIKAGSLSAAMIAVLKGQCLIRTGREDEGEVAILGGLPVLRQRGEALKVETASALVLLGDAAMARWDYGTARRRYEEAGSIPGGAHPGLVSVKLAQATAFDGGEAPLRYADEAIASAQAMPGTTKEKLAELRTLRARTLLNQGRNAEAYEELKVALKLTGGLDRRVNLVDVTLRGDLALAARLTGDVGNVRKYLAYTGAGRIAESPFTRALTMNPPVCGNESGLRPEDFAVVDFAIAPDGHVFSARTVYTRGSADAAARFARAVSQWVWAPEDIKDIPSFYLLAPRVELRCTTQEQDVPQVETPLLRRFMAWAAPLIGIIPNSDAAGMAKSLEEAATGMNSPPDPVRQVALLGLQALARPTSALERYNKIEEALTLLAGQPVPVEARNTLALMGMHTRISSKGIKGVPPARPYQMLSLLDNPAFARDALAADTARLLTVDLHDFFHGRIGDEVALLSEVATDKYLPEHHPLRQLAYLRLADRAARDKAYGDAERYFKATGLTEEQCSFLDNAPSIKRSNVTHDDYPATALEWGFDGWVRLEFDINSEGRPTSIRPLIAYPPFIFTDAASRSAKDFVFESSYRPGGGQACSAARQTIVYRP